MSSSKPELDSVMRARIMARPDCILDDRDVMDALIAANGRAMGENIVDLRGIAMERLEARLDRLEDTHRNVIAAAYENLAGTNQIHRAVLALLEVDSFETFLRSLGGEVADILGVDAMRLILETEQAETDPGLSSFGNVLCVVQPGFVAAYQDPQRSSAARPVLLRQIDGGNEVIYGEASGRMASEACLLLDLGTGRLPAMLIMGSEDPNQFTPHHGTDLLGFFAGVFERAMRRWLA